MELLSRLDMCAILALCVIICVNSGVLALDNFGLLYGSLRTFQAHACDGDELRLNCTQSTIISINFVSYGREAGRGDLCPGPSTHDAPTCRLEKALTVIEEKCRGQVLCRMLLTPDLFSDDPCPGVRKYAEVAYKCRPESFRNKIVCEGERMYLNCPEGQSLSVYSAAFGTTSSEVLECGQTDSVQADDCQVSFASEILMKLCNGLQRCTLVANSATFGDRKCTGRKHLKVTYNCVQREVLIRPASPSDKTGNEETIHTTSFPGWVRAYEPPQLNSMQRHNDHRVKTSTLPSNAFRSEMQSDEVPLDGSRREELSEDQRIVGFMSQLMSAHKYMTGNKEKLILYVTLTTGLGFLIFGTVLAARFLVTHIKSRRNSRVDPLPVSSDDQFFSDSDLEQFDPPPPPPVIHYTASLRRQSSNAQPRAPVTDGAELNHYFS